MNEQTKSLIRHLLTALGMIFAVFGLADAAEVIEVLSADLDKIWDAILVLVGLVTTVIGFFTNKERFDSRVES